MKARRFKIQIQLEGPILTAATNPGSPGVDAPFTRNSDELPCFPGTLIKGKLLQSWGVLNGLAGAAFLGASLPDQNRAERWLGREAGNEDKDSDDPSKFLPARGRAHFSDFVDMSAPTKCDRIRTRICMDEDLHSADDGALQMIETPYQPGEAAVFEGFVDFFPEDERDVAVFPDAVRLGLSAIPSFGAERGIGFGKVRQVTVGAVVQPAHFSGKLDLGGGRTTFGLTLTTNDPLCFAQPQPAQNLFESSNLISGAVIKGAMAEMMNRQGDSHPRLQRYLSHIRFRHARPVKDGDQAGIPPAIPLSAVFYGNELRDAVLCRDALALGIPEFQPDWKPDKRETAYRKFGIATPDTELRIRTRIDKEKRRAQDENLFGYESVLPKGFRWLGNVDLYHVPEGERTALLDELTDLLTNGLFGIGKNKAHLTVDAGPEIAKRYTDRRPQGETLVIQLHTPALLGTAEAWQAARTAQDVHRIYQESWGELHPDLSLSHYFAQQEMAGGFYLHRRFRGGQYEPWLLTSAGSVFVFQPSPAQLTTVLEQWGVTGLPLTPSVRRSYGLGTDPFTMWQHCPYVPENGFGEIGVNLHLNWQDMLLEAHHA